MAVSVEEVSSSLVREFLSRKGLKRTIACMDEEHPRTEASINNRSHLRQILNMEGLYRKNKVQNAPLKTLLEIIVKYCIKDLNNDKVTSNEYEPPKSERTTSSPAVTPTAMNDTEQSTTAFFVSKHAKLRSDIEEIYPPQPIFAPLLPETDRLSGCSQTGFWAGDPKDQRLVDTLHDSKSSIRREPEKLSVTESTQKSRTNRMRRGMMAGPIASTPQESNKKRQNRRLEVSQPLLIRDEGKQTV
ncbi:putative ubiquitin carboxyl-terminal hydrolase MINDY-4 [Nibea albiflora]|uniref:Ubiquitin carboxyl-terminal hydrolase MINDY-4 n=1 Tax=Nibea albiflora TaxID=240163 RepID=A0ACB7EPG1_NIBAL|nr:putative ubiquitin carboxyl-terminal hydrolase MINDY-4 [Nibea albiflora]